VNPPFKIDFVGIGAAKAGTTWLGHMLESHPDLCMSVPKEVYFFNKKSFYGSKAFAGRFTGDLNGYKNHFLHCKPDQLKGEITPGYSIDAIAAEGIKAHNPDIKILYCLRNPVDRVISHYNFVKYFLREESRSIQQAVREEPDLIDMSLYYKNITTYLRHFQKDQLCIIWFEDIATQPEMVLNKVFTFLGVDPSYRPEDMYKKSNPGRKSRYPGLQQFIARAKKLFIRLGLSGIIRYLKSAGLRTLMTKINSKPIPMETIAPEIKKYILDRVREDVRQLEIWTGKDLSQWLV
jgi:hypothetical protein